MKKKTWITLILALIVCALLYVFVFSRVTAAQIRDTLAASGNFAPFLYVLAFTLLPAVFFPVAILALAGGLLFGLWQGSLLTFIGAMLNCTLMFLLGRYTMRDRLQAYVREKLNPVWQERLAKSGGREGFFLLISLRLIPLVPYNLINYAFSLTEMSLRNYLIASAIGIIPGTVVFINIGDKAIDLRSPAFWLSIGLLVLLIILTALGSKLLFPAESKKRGEVTNGRKETD